MNIEKKLYQWDTGQKLTGCTGLYVDFPIDNEVYRVETADGMCIIPDELLQTSGGHKVYECMTNNTIRSFAFSVTSRPKPPDYVYTPTERLTFEGLVQKVDDAVADMIRKAESGEFDGHTPVKGTDYFTTEEIQQIQNEVSSGAIGEFKSVVDTETDKFNANVTEKVNAYNQNDSEKTTSYNANATEKLNAYNTNANNRVAEFDAHTEQIQTDISELKSDLGKLEYVDYILTEGKYADYKNKRLATLAETNVVEFDVTNVSKIHYKYTISAVDQRGLYFTNAEGTALDGYQTLANSQDISVPDNATKCYATVNSIEDIICYDIYGAFGKMYSKIIAMNERFAEVESAVIGEQPVEILDALATKVDKTSAGITWTWNTDKTEISVVGTKSGIPFNNLINSTSALPSVFEAGATYNCEYESTDDNVKVTILYYVGGTNTKNEYVDNTNKSFTIPTDCDGITIRFQYLGASGTSVNATATMPKIYTIPEVKSIDERVVTLENAVFGSDENPLATIKETAGMMSLFHTVGCIGDSLSSGECAYTKEDGTTGYKDLYEHSWGQYLARMTGNTYHNFSKGGLTTKTWLASSYATECFDSEHLCDAYFIGLGQNDKNVSMTVGTTADIDLSDYNNNSDTYYGNYGKIIQKLKEHQPKAPIFCFVDPYPPSDAQEYNVAVRNIVSMFDNVYLIDLDTYAKDMYRSGLIRSQLRSGHYSALGYQQMAYIIATYVDWIVRNNLDKFSQIEFIGTEYEWVD